MLTKDISLKKITGKDIIIHNIRNQLKDKLQTSLFWLNTTEGDILSKGIKILSSFIVGQPIGFLLSFIIECADSTIRKEFLPNLLDVANRLENEKSLNKNFIQSPEGQKLLKDTLRKIIQETNQEKIEYLKRFLITTYSDKTPDSELINIFFKILTSMEPTHIKLLTILKNPKEIITKVANERKKNPRLEGERPYGKNNHSVYFTEDHNDDLNNFYLHIDPVIYSNAHKDLVTWNILEIKIRKFWLYDDDIPGSNFDSLIRDIERWTTQFGRQFLDHIYKNDSQRQEKSL